ncbi:hypothetical protein [Nereida sp. MMG025]|nr:hypothetical protein [Nereida sp. MMG025]
MFDLERLQEFDDVLTRQAETVSAQKPASQKQSAQKCPMQKEAK